MSDETTRDQETREQRRARQKARAAEADAPAAPTQEQLKAMLAAGEVEFVPLKRAQPMPEDEINALAQQIDADIARGVAEKKAMSAASSVGAGVVWLGWVLCADGSNGYRRCKVAIPSSELWRFLVGPASGPDMRATQAAIIHREHMGDTFMTELHVAAGEGGS